MQILREAYRIRVGNVFTRTYFFLKALYLYKGKNSSNIKDLVETYDIIVHFISNMHSRSVKTGLLPPLENMALMGSMNAPFAIVFSPSFMSRYLYILYNKINLS